MINIRANMIENQWKQQKFSGKPENWVDFPENRASFPERKIPNSVGLQG